MRHLHLDGGGASRDTARGAESRAPEPGASPRPALPRCRPDQRKGEEVNLVLIPSYGELFCFRFFLVVVEIAMYWL